MKQAWTNTTRGGKTKGFFLLVGGFILLVITFWAAGVIIKEVAPNVIRRFFDRPVLDFIVDLRTGGLTSLMKLLNVFGSTAFGVIFLLGGAVVSFALSRDVRFPIFFLLVLLGLFILDDLIKQLITLRRPGVSNLVPPREAGFPDGYTTVASGLAYAVSFFLIERQPTRLISWIWPVMTIVAILIGFARCYLGVAWPTDALAGFALGAGWGTVCGTSVKIFFGYQRLWPRRARA